MPDETIYTRTVAENADLEAAATAFLQACLPLQQMDLQGKRVLLKPNIVGPVSKAITSPEIICAAAAFVRARGGAAFVAEGAGFEFDTDQVFRILDLYELGAREGFEVIDLDRTGFFEVATGDPIFPVIQVSAAVREADVIFNLPKLKQHSLTRVTFSAKNLMGLINRDTRRRFHARNIEHGIAVLVRTIPTDFTLVDGIRTNTRAMHGQTAYKGLLMAGCDPLAVDKACCRELGFDPRSIPHLRELSSCGHGRSGARTGKIDFGNIFIRSGYRAIYALDSLLGLLGFKSSIVPQVHWYLGLRPAVGHADAAALKKGNRICPAAAIDSQKKRIIKSRCIRVKCLRCIDIEPPGSFVVKGLRKS